MAGAYSQIFTATGPVVVKVGDVVIYRGKVRWRMRNKWRIGRHNGRRLKRRATLNTLLRRLCANDELVVRWWRAFGFINERGNLCTVSQILDIIKRVRDISNANADRDSRTARINAAAAQAAAQ